MTGYLFDENLPRRLTFTPSLPVTHSTDLTGLLQLPANDVSIRLEQPEQVSHRGSADQGRPTGARAI